MQGYLCKVTYARLLMLGYLCHALFSYKLMTWMAVNENIDS